MWSTIIPNCLEEPATEYKMEEEGRICNTHGFQKNPAERRLMCVCCFDAKKLTINLLQTDGLRVSVQSSLVHSNSFDKLDDYNVKRGHSFSFSLSVHLVF